jgi:hypothetical protein
MMSPFWKGFLSVFVWPATSASKAKKYRKQERSDADALRGDWDKVGNDMRRVIDRISKEKPQ